MNNPALQKLLPGDIILTNRIGVNWGSLPIKVANFSKRGFSDRGWTHAALYIGEGKVIEAFPNGVVEREINTAYLNNDYNLLFLRHKTATQDQLNRVIEVCVNKDGHKYDFKALSYFILYNFIPHWFHFLFENRFVISWLNIESAYFCSELVASGLKEANIYCFEKVPHRVMPIDFHNPLLFETVDRINIPTKANKFLYYFKATIFYFLYLGAIFVFFCIGILLLIGPIILLTKFLFPKKKNKKATQANRLPS